MNDKLIFMQPLIPNCAYLCILRPLKRLILFTGKSCNRSWKSTCYIGVDDSPIKIFMIIRNSGHYWLEAKPVQKIQKLIV
jgi:hypothetical protein